MTNTYLKSTNEDILLAPDPSRLLRADENIDYLERCFENGDLLSSRQYHILYENTTAKLERIVKRKELGFGIEDAPTPKDLITNVYNMYKKSIGREHYTMDSGMGWVDSSGVPKFGTYDSTREEIIVHTVFQKLIGE